MKLTQFIISAIAIGYLNIANAQEIEKKQPLTIDSYLIGKQKQQELEATEKKYSTQQIYDGIRSAGELYSMELSEAIQKGTLKGWSLASANFDRGLRLKDLLSGRAEQGDGLALFYSGLLAGEYAEKIQKNATSRSLNEMAQEEYRKSINYFKKACNLNWGSACWNVGVIYRDGTGVIPSGLAASEWFYKSGMIFLKANDRENALTALEAIQAIDKQHILGKKLSDALIKTAPK